MEKVMGRSNAQRQPQQRQNEKRDGKVKLRTINVMDGIDLVVTEDWQNSNGDIVTYTAKLDEDGFIAEEVENLRMIHLKKNAKTLLTVEITDEQFDSLNRALYSFYLEGMSFGK